MIISLSWIVSHFWIVWGRKAIAFAIEIVIVFVIQTFDQINSSIGSTSQIVPHTLCVYTHMSTLVSNNSVLAFWCWPFGSIRNKTKASPSTLPTTTSQEELWWQNTYINVNILGEPLMTKPWCPTPTHFQTVLIIVDDVRLFLMVELCSPWLSDPGDSIMFDCFRLIPN